MNDYPHYLSRRSFLRFAAGTAVVGLAALTGCAGDNSASGSSDSAATASSSSSASGTGDSGSSAASAASASASAQENSGKVLVAYYSAQGHTRRVARELAGHLGADLFEIVPSDPYTDADLDWNDEDSRVNDEHEHPKKQDIELTQVTPDGFDAYDTVLIGYPIWWSDIAWPTNNFAKKNDFSGKKVASFCTSLSSGVGSSGQHLQQMCGDCTWLDSTRFEEDADLSDVDSWADSLDI
ncbi:MAG: flavodoxin [Eggerthellaceae bacterium]|jgi:flavodoxin